MYLAHAAVAPVMPAGRFAMGSAGVWILLGGAGLVLCGGLTA
jgi:hypothetical protein